MEVLRLKGLTNASDVESAFLEPEGQVSVILKKETKPLTPLDLKH